MKLRKTNEWKREEEKKNKLKTISINSSSSRGNIEGISIWICILQNRIVNEIEDEEKLEKKENLFENIKRIGNVWWRHLQKFAIYVYSLNTIKLNWTVKVFLRKLECGLAI